MQRAGILGAVLWVMAANAGGVRAQDSPMLGPEAPGAVAVETPAQPAPGPATEALPLGAPGAHAKPLRDLAHARSDGQGKGAASSGSAPLAPGEGWWRTAGSLALIIALIVALGGVARIWARRGGALLGAAGPGGRAPAGILQVLGRYPMGRGQTLILLKLDRRVLLLCQTVGSKGGGVRTLCELTDPEEVASVLVLTSEAEGRSLASRFREMVAGFETSHEAAEAVLAPVVLPVQASSAPDPVSNLRTRLVRLRDVGLGGVA